MIASLRIISPGLSTTIQDLGRPGFQRFGVSVGGALDPVALQSANMLVGNPANTGALEVLYVGPTFAVEAQDVRLAFVGAQAAIEILSDAEATIGTAVAPMQSVRVRRGQVVRVGSLKNGASLYIAIEGGLAIAPVLGSVATDSRGRIGGWQGGALRAGDALPLRCAVASEREEYAIEGLQLSGPRRFRVVPGPQTDYFCDGEIERFFAEEFTVGAGSNRMGLRLEGRPLRHRGGFDIVSDAVVSGSIQVPGNGQPIVLLADRQTTGGYPKIATVISADLPALGRLPIGAKAAFAPVTMEAAAAARRELFAAIAELPDKIVRVPPPPSAVAARLSECNLISGVYDAAA
ncbi:MAG: biotin-dependent carboxyltransferase family protein [Xanthobacteraceae bacterium]